MQVDFLASKQLTAKELATQRERLQALTKATRVIEIDLDGERVSVRPSVVSGLTDDGSWCCRGPCASLRLSWIARLVQASPYDFDQGARKSEFIRTPASTPCARGVLASTPCT